HPQNFRDMVDRYRLVASKGRGTAEATEAEQKLNRVIERHQAALRNAIADYETRMDDALRQHKPQEAYDLWKDFPPSLRTLQSDQEISQILQKKLPPGFTPK